MAIHYAVVGLRPLITGVVPSVIEFPAPRDCRLNRIFARINTANGAGDVILDINVNGTSIYGDPMDQPRILAGETRLEEFPVADLLEGDMVSVDADAIPLGGVSGLYIIVQLQDSPTVEQYVKDMYEGAYGRLPSGGELSAAVSALTSACNGGTTLTATRAFQNTIFTASEYTSLGTTNDEYLEDVYNALLGRLSDPGGFAFWSNQMTLGVTRSQILDFFNSSIEHQSLRAQPWCPQMPLVTSANKLQGFDISASAPSTNQVLTWNGSVWVPTTWDVLMSAFDFKASARAATTGALAAYGASAGVLTGSSNGALGAQDGVTLVATDRLLVKNESGGNQKYNGLYVVTQAGDGSHPFILTRASDANTSAKVTAGMLVPITEGTANGDTSYWLTTNDPITLDTTALTFTQFGSSGSPTGSAGGDLTGTYPNPTLAAAGPGAATYGGSGDFVESLTLDAKGRVTALTTDTPAGGGGGGGAVPGLIKGILYTNFNTSPLSGSTTRYALFGVDTIQSDENTGNFYMPFDCTITRMSVHLHTNQPSGGSLVFTLRASGVDQFLVLTIPSSGALGGYDVNGSVFIPAGTYVSIGIVNNSSSTSGGIASIAVTYETFGGGLFSGMRLTKSSSIAHDTPTKVAYTSEEYDTDGYHDNSSNTTRATIPVSGWYDVILQGEYLTGSTSASRFMTLFLNGSVLHFVSGDGTSQGMNLAITKFLNAGDYLEQEVYQNSGGSLTCVTAFMVSRSGVIGSEPAAFSGCRLQVSGSSGGTLTTAALAGSAYDTDGFRSNSSTIVIPSTGYYHVSAQYNYYTNSGNPEFYAWDGVSGRYATWGAVLTTGNIQTALLSFDRHFTAGDVIKFNTTAASAGGVLGDETGYPCYITIHKITTGGSGGVSPSQNVMLFSRTTQTASGSWADTTFFVKIASGVLLCLPRQWKFSIEIGGASMAFDNIKILRTAKDSLTVLNSVVVRFGGSTSPTLPTGVSESDPISLSMDTDHDYWVAAHVASGASGSANITVRNPCEFDWSANPSRWITGDHVGDSPIPAGTAAAYFYISRVRAT